MPDSPVNTEAIDHIVLTVKDTNATCAFYVQVLGIRVITFGNGRKGLSLGAQKINLHQYGQEFEPKAKKFTPGSADLCFITATPILEKIEHLSVNGFEILEGQI
jgi:catechol 2,3-dioxygenase-like lactoylglutathione lyase family enzyme